MKKYLWTFLAVVVAALYIWTIGLGNDLLQPSIASKILRFHVIANSDEARDQEIKEQIRDAVGAYMQPLLKDSVSITETKEIVNAHLEELVQLANEVLAEGGYDYEARALITTTYFPEKSYGPYTFPKGDYEALQIVLGEGAGKNWWCVLYPNMCFRGSVYEVVEKDAETALKEVLSPWEYADVFESGNVELRFKFLEYFTKSE